MRWRLCSQKVVAGPEGEAQGTVVWMAAGNRAAARATVAAQAVAAARVEVDGIGKLVSRPTRR